MQIKISQEDAMEEDEQYSVVTAIQTAILYESVQQDSSEIRQKKLEEARVNAARRLANESMEQRAKRLAKLAEYSRRRIAQETPEQRQERLRRMAEYSARRIAHESAEQRAARLAQMREYARRRRQKMLATHQLVKPDTPHSILEPEVIYCEEVP